LSLCRPVAGDRFRGWRGAAAEATRGIVVSQVEGKVRFNSYSSVPDRHLAVEWLEVDPTEESHYETIRAAGFEPEDAAVKVGCLRASWGEHREGCLLVCYGSLSISRRVAISDRPASLKIH
jgi:hypothetical protein